MLCESCKKNPATVHSVVIKNGQKREQYLCAECARQVGFKFDSFPALLGMLFGKENDIISAHKCSCGTDMVQFYESGLLGCPNCYNEHREELLGIIKRAQGGRTEHTGRIPSKREPKEPDIIARLKAELAQAVNNEEYERAAELRDQIKSLSERKTGPDALNQ
ncbi:MAG: UvrB/uvrC motif protein [Firmicutes bacterium ADurb.Bin182]|nr:MAG: UvrB/uvrC motif protein [Firmicutes bacterium ADurb.Bin182]